MKEPTEREKDAMHVLAERVVNGIQRSMESQADRIRDLETALSIVDYLARDTRLPPEERTERIHNVVSQALHAPSARGTLNRERNS